MKKIQINKIERKLKENQNLQIMKYQMRDAKFKKIKDLD